MQAEAVIAATSSLEISTNLAPILDRLACPACRGRLAIRDSHLHCLSCHAVYPSHQGIPLLGSVGSVGTQDQISDQETSIPYQKLFLDGAGAMSYKNRYEKSFFKRLTTRRELSMIRRLLSTQERCRVMLDLPCGNGRVSEPLAEFADLLVEADIGPGQVALGQATSRLQTPQVWMAASVFNIPLQDQSVDGVVCNRLIHHLRSAEERERAIAELLRVARRFVLLTFFDYRSLKNLSLLARQWYRRKSHKNAVRIEIIADIARAHGGELVTSPRLALIGSGQRYALLVKSS